MSVSIVETDDGEVARDVEPEALRCDVQARGHAVVEAEHGGGAVGAGEQFGCGRQAAGGLRLGGHLERGLDGEPVLGQRCTIRIANHSKEATQPPASLR